MNRALNLTARVGCALPRAQARAWALAPPPRVSMHAGQLACQLRTGISAVAPGQMTCDSTCKRVHMHDSTFEKKDFDCPISRVGAPHERPQKADRVAESHLVHHLCAASRGAANRQESATQPFEGVRGTLRLLRDMSKRARASSWSQKNTVWTRPPLQRTFFFKQVLACFFAAC